MTYDIEHGIPLPKPRGKGYTAALRKLAVGDSVFLPIGLNNAGNVANYAGLTGKYRAQSVPGGVRIWRTKE
jgi:hypothetical protein